MPIPASVPLNESVYADVYFFESDNKTPVAFSGGVAYAVFAPGNLLVLSGIATQDLTNPAHWQTNLVIPPSAPTTATGQYYTLMWQGQTLNNNYYNQTQTFAVNNPVAPDQYESAVVALANQPFNINFVSPYQTLNTFAIQIVDSSESVVAAYPGLPLTPTGQNGSQYIYTFNLNDPVVLGYLSSGSNPNAPILSTANTITGYTYGTPSFGVQPYVIYINYTDPYNNQQTEIQPLYIANTVAVQLMNNMRNFVDRIRNWDNIPQLRVDERTLLHFLISGLMRFNSTPPQQIYFTLNNLPFQFMFYVEKCACYELMQAQTLAEGMTAFNFSGLSVQLDSDRSQYLSAMTENLRTDLESMVLAKQNFARSGGGAGIGTIGISIGPVSNWVWKTYPFNNAVFGNALPFLA
jgi:hypothetical protein